jgi:predicted HAD superfamily Cof-like phosphohydrolase
MPLYPSPLVLVEEFHLTYGQKVRITPHIDIPERILRIELIREESEELETATNEDDLIEVVDALADILYVTYGAAVAHGINIDFVLGLTDHTSPARLINLALEAEGAPLPSAPRFIKEVLLHEIPVLQEAVKSYNAASNALNVKELQNSLTKIIFTCYALSARLGVDIDDVLQEVQRSNMSKLGEDGKPIYRESDGKVLKGPNFFTPDITKILENQGWVK